MQGPQDNTTTMPDSTAPALRAAVVGATGYSGQELLRLLARHPHVDVTGAFGSSSTDAPRRLPALAKVFDGDVVPYSDDAVAACADVAFVGLPEAASATVVPALVARGLQVIDLSGAFRLRDRGLRAQWCPKSPDPLPEGTAYGLAEFDAAALRGARLVSCPGCYPTASLLALEPLVGAGLIDAAADIVIDAKSGISGAGKGATERTHFSENHGSVAAYGPFGHRHTPEMEQELGRQVTFVPHLVPLDRGLMATIHTRLERGASPDAVRDAYARAFANAPFVRLTADTLPEIKHVAHTNFCDIGWRIDVASGRIVLVSVIDNLVKGAAGQAVQNFNVSRGFDETLGLR